MCGINGFVGPGTGKNDPQSILNSMNDAIRHRGPDGEGVFLDQHAGLGHVRLAILDLSPAGSQPMKSACGQYIIAYNGEVYNYNQIKKELEAKSYRFQSHTDTEVILNAFIEWGTDCLHRLNGMFAFAILDLNEKRIFIARDRYGIKPLYYCIADNQLIFSSEQKGILRHPSVKVELDKEGLFEYFTFQNIFTDKTLLKDIRLFPSGSYAVIEIDKPVASLKPLIYWDFHFEDNDAPFDDREYEEEVDRLFKNAVKRQLVADVEIGAYLSGGMDSGSITALAARQFPYLKTFTCGFDLHSASGLELGFDERERSEFMSYLFKTEHYEMVLKSGDMERVMPKFSWHIEEPRVGQSYPNYYVAQLASRFVKVALSGAGGDELFGGYPWRYYRALVNDSFDDYIDKYYAFWQRLIPNELIRKVFDPIWHDVKHVWTRDLFRDVFLNHKNELSCPEDYVNHSLYFEAKTFLHGLLVIEDKISMAHGLEVRVPFLDNDLVDFAQTIPVRLKLRRLNEILRINENEPASKQHKHFHKTKDGKLILREVMRRYIPNEITNAVKKGFSAPDASWFRGDSIEYVKDLLLNPKANVYSYLEYKEIEKILYQHFDGKRNRRLLIWSLINFEWWCRQYLI